MWGGVVRALILGVGFCGMSGLLIMLALPDWRGMAVTVAIAFYGVGVANVYQWLCS